MSASRSRTNFCQYIAAFVIDTSFKVHLMCELYNRVVDFYFYTIAHIGAINNTIHSMMVFKIVENLSLLVLKYKFSEHSIYILCSISFCVT